MTIVFKWHRAFTILELFVSIGIIAVLVAMVSFVAGKLRSSSDAAESMSNLRQLAAANLAYAADHGGDYAPAQEPENLVRWHGARNSFKGEFDPTKGYLAPYLGREGRVKDDPALEDVLSTSSFERGTGGYGYNAAYIGGQPGDIFTPANASQIPVPSAVVMFATCAFPRKKGLQEYPFCEPFFEVKPDGSLGRKLSPSVHFRHSGKAHVAWADGHVTAEAPSTVSGKNIYGGDNEKYRIGWFGPETENGYWNPDREEN